MARTAHTHKETVRPSFAEAERPDPTQEKGASSNSREGISSNPGVEATEVAHEAGTSQALSPEESEVLYNDELGTELPHDEGVLEPATPPDLSTIDYGQVPLFNSVMGEALTAELVFRYPFRGDYSICPPGPNQTTEPQRVGWQYMQIN